jgi:hypothetical protein
MLELWTWQSPTLNYMYCIQITLHAWALDLAITNIELHVLHTNYTTCLSFGLGNHQHWSIAYELQYMLERFGLGDHQHWSIAYELQYMLERFGLGNHQHWSIAYELQYMLELWTWQSPTLIYCIWITIHAWAHWTWQSPTLIYRIHAWEPLTLIYCILVLMISRLICSLFNFDIFWHSHCLISCPSVLWHFRWLCRRVYRILVSWLKKWGMG